MKMSKTATSTATSGWMKSPKKLYESGTGAVATKSKTSSALPFTAEVDKNLVEDVSRELEE